jgi:hypothetical protein
MLYHEDCQEKEAREFGFPLQCKQRWSNGMLDYECPACGERFSFHEEDDLPEGITEK